MTLKETIVRELLESVDDPTGPQDVLNRYSKSKGPLYIGLAEATNVLERRVSVARAESTQFESRRDELQEALEAKNLERQELEEKIQSLGNQIEQTEDRLDEVGGLLNRAKDLRRVGFGEEQLDGLQELLSKIAVEHGVSTEEAVEQFFQKMRGYERMVGLDLETKRSENNAALAKAEAARWESERRSKETLSKARIESVDLVEHLLDQGVKADDLPLWSTMLQRTGMSAAEFTEVLETFGTVEKLVQSRRNEANEIKAKVSESKSEVKALGQERNNLQAAIRVVGEESLEEIKEMSSQIKLAMAFLFEEATRVGRLQFEAAELGESINAARILKSGDRNSWIQLPVDLIEHYLLVIVTWAQGEGHDIMVPIPEVIGKNKFLIRSTSLHLSQILYWGFSGILLLAERAKPRG